MWRLLNAVRERLHCPRMLFGCKHIPLAIALSKLGVSYAAFCATESQDPASQTGVKDLTLAHPLKARPDSKVMILIDCYANGEVDSQQNLRVCPMDNILFRSWLRGVLEARCGNAEPEALNPHEIFICFNGGKDRRRSFYRPHNNDNTKF